MAKTHYAFFLFLLLLSKISFGQNYGQKEHYLVDSLDLSLTSTSDRSLIDSVLNIYHGCATDTCRINAVSIIVEESWDDAIWPKYNQWIYSYTSDRIKQSSDSSDLYYLKKAYASALNNIGYLYNSQGESDSALMYYNKTLVIQKEIDDQKSLAGTYINIAYIFLSQGIIERALEHYYKSLFIEEQLQNKIGMATALNGIGYIYYKQGDNVKALENYNKSLQIRDSLNDQYGIATCLNNIGLVYRDQKKWKQALDYFQRCMDIEKSLGDKNGVAISVSHIGYLNEVLGFHEKALDAYYESLEIYKALNNKNGMSHSYKYLADIMLVKGNVQLAREYGLKSLEIAQELQYPSNIRDAAESMNKISRQDRKWKEALFYQDLFIKMRDSLFNEETLATSINQAYKYKYEKQAIADSIRNIDNIRIAEAENQKLRLIAVKERQQTYFLIGGLLLTLIFIWIIYGRLNTIQKQKKIILKQNMNLEIINEDLKQFASIVSHDLKAPLRGITTLINFIDTDYPDIDGNMKEQIGLIKGRSIKMSNLIDGILTYSKAGQDNIEKNKVDLNKLVKSIIDDIPNEQNIDIKIENHLPTLIGNKYQLIEIFSNLIGNAIKYNDKPTGTVNIKYNSIKDIHEFSISDNGPGIPGKFHKQVFELFKRGPNANQSDSTGVGLAIVKKLVNRYGGKLFLHSVENEGATFTFTLPKDIGLL